MTLPEREPARLDVVNIASLSGDDLATMWSDPDKTEKVILAANLLLADPADTHQDDQLRKLYESFGLPDEATESVLDALYTVPAIPDDGNIPSRGTVLSSSLRGFARFYQQDSSMPNVMYQRYGLRTPHRYNHRYLRPGFRSGEFSSENIVLGGVFDHNSCFKQLSRYLGETVPPDRATYFEANASDEASERLAAFGSQGRPANQLAVTAHGQSGEGTPILGKTSGTGEKAFLSPIVLGDVVGRGLIQPEGRIVMGTCQAALNGNNSPAAEIAEAAGVPVYATSGDITSVRLVEGSPVFYLGDEQLPTSVFKPRRVWRFQSNSTPAS